MNRRVIFPGVLLHYVVKQPSQLVRPVARLRRRRPREARYVMAVALFGLLARRLFLPAARAVRTTASHPPTMSTLGSKAKPRWFYPVSP